MAGIFSPEQIGKRFMFDKEAKKELTYYISVVILILSRYRYRPVTVFGSY